MLARPSASGLLFEAAALLGDPSLLALLREFDVTDVQVRAAVEACDPQEWARRDRLDAELREAVAVRLPEGAAPRVGEHGAGADRDVRG